MSVLHLADARDWRGGENQFRLLAEHLSPEWRGRLVAPRGSELLKRLGGTLETDAARCGGLLDIGSVLAVRRLIKKHGVRLLHAHGSRAHATALVARAGLGIPLVVSRRNAFAISSGWKYRAADHVIAVSRAAAGEVARTGASTVSVIHDAVDAKGLEAARPERLELSAGAAIVLCVAAFSAEKDHETLLKAWRQVEAGAPQAWLVLAGDGALMPAMQRLAGEMGLKRVRFLGWRDDVQSLIKGADVVVLASKQEGFGSSLCEAQMAGKPVAATRAGGMPEAVEDGVSGLLSDVGDAAGLAGNLALLLDDLALRMRLGLNGAERAGRLFLPQAIARQHEAVYRSLL